MEKAGASVKIDLATTMAVRITGSISDRDVKRAERLVAKHAQALMAAWRKLHGKRQGVGGRS
ncbi:MAG: DUF4160 domain-containing protein [Cyanobacteria bacterium]|nr:DUF4160 domain-containing protein [Cyanobacteriota bacterium]